MVTDSTKEELEAKLYERQLMQRVFCKSSDGPYALALIWNRLGGLATNPEEISPDLMAFGNWLLWECGIYIHPDAKDTIFKQFVSMAANSTDADLVDKLNELGGNNG